MLLFSLYVCEMLRYVMVVCLLFCTGFWLSRCAPAKQVYTLESLPERQLTFSYGGGFTGEFNEYLLLPNGQLYHRRKVINPVSFRPVEPIDAKLAKDFFTTYDKQHFDELSLDDPGNMTYSIMAVRAGDTTRVTWGGAEAQPNEALRSYWRRAMQTFDGKKSLPQAQ